MNYPSSGLDGPSVPVRVEPLVQPDPQPPKRIAPPPREPVPERDPEKVPA